MFQRKNRCEKMALRHFDTRIMKVLQTTHDSGDIRYGISKGMQCSCMSLMSVCWTLFKSARIWQSIIADSEWLKLNQNVISGNLLNLFRDFLNERKQRVTFDGEFSTGENVNAGFLKVPYLVLYCFWFTLMICQKAFHLMQSFLQMIRLYFLLQY